MPGRNPAGSSRVSYAIGDLRPQRRNARGTGFVPEQAIDAFSHEPLLPAPHRRLADAGPPAVPIAARWMRLAELTSMEITSIAEQEPPRLWMGFDFQRPLPTGPAYSLCEAQRSKVGCSAWLGFDAIFQSYYYFSSSVSFFQIPASLKDFTQPVKFVKDRRYLSGLHEMGLEPATSSLGT